MPTHKSDFSHELNDFILSEGWETSHFTAAMSDEGCRISPQTVDGWRQGRQFPKSNKLSAIASVMGLDSVHILLWIEDQHE